jgi:hypothetical protein
MAEVQGDAGFDFLMTSHPVAVLNPAQVDDRAAELVPAVLARLTAPGTPAETGTRPGTDTGTRPGTETRTETDVAPRPGAS